MPTCLPSWGGIGPALGCSHCPGFIEMSLTEQFWSSAVRLTPVVGSSVYPDVWTESCSGAKRLTPGSTQNRLSCPHLLEQLPECTACFPPCQRSRRPGSAGSRLSRPPLWTPCPVWDTVVLWGLPGGASSSPHCLLVRGRVRASRPSFPGLIVLQRRTEGAWSQAPSLSVRDAFSAQKSGLSLLVGLVFRQRCSVFWWCLFSDLLLKLGAMLFPVS